MKTFLWIWSIEFRDLALVTCLTRVALLEIEADRPFSGILFWFIAFAVFFTAKRPPTETEEKR